MFERAHARDDTFDVAGAGGGEGVGGSETLATGATTGDDETGIDNGADERNAAFDGLIKALFRMECETEFVAKELLDDVDVAENLGAFGHGDDDKEVVDVAAVMFVSEIEGHETVELVEEDVREELAGQIADDDAAAFGLVEKAFVRGEIFPVEFGAADMDTFHGVVEDDLVPEELEDLIETLAVVGAASDMVARMVGVGELAFETPDDALVEFLVE